ncbi:MAG: beta-xylosidase, partial [Microbacterium sp.]|uniref:RICIN domain-containing protein n=1 Tax=Microbacterium sp. TaxID=51671 RepID=UPI0026051559
GTASAAVQQTVTGAASQQWTIVPKPYGKFQLKNNASGACLAVSGSGQTNGTPVLQWTCGESPNFLWSRADIGDGTSHLVAAHSGKCLTLRDGNTVDGAGYIQWSCDVTSGADYLKFEVRPVG